MKPSTDEFNEDDVNLLEEVEVEWETPEVTAYYQENEVEVTYQFGIIQETRDGVLKRINRIWTDDDMLKDETNFIFSKEEASTIIAMIASHMDSLVQWIIINRKGKWLPKLWAVFSVFQERSYQPLFGLLKLLRMAGQSLGKPTVSV